MVDITHKTTTLRKAIASAIVKVSKQETIDAIIERKIPKGDVFEFSRVAGLFAVKKTSEVIPDCHPLPVEFTAIRHNIDGLHIHIEVEVHTIYRTGVEVEAMHGAAITALTMYDMLKPIDKNVEISTIKLISKKGGKSDVKNEIAKSINAAVVVVSDSVSKGESEDTSGKLAVERLNKLGITSIQYNIIADEKNEIASITNLHCGNNIDLLIFTGGTGLSPRDVTPDVIKQMLDIEIPGIMETLRKYGQERMPYAMLSRGVAGFVKNTLVITLPGSKNAVKEAMDVLFPQVLHLFEIRDGERHE